MKKKSVLLAITNMKSSSVPLFLMVLEILFVMAFSQGAEVVSRCPHQCKCREFKNGKVMVDCENANLMTIPQIIPPNTVHVDLAWNDIGIVSNVAFSNWPNTVESLDLSYNDIIKVETRAFGNLNDLHSLDLHTNKINELNNVTIPHSLRKLVLGNNPLEDVGSMELVDAPNLEILDITNCKLFQIQSRLQNLRALKSVSYTKYDEYDNVKFPDSVHVITVSPAEKPKTKHKDGSPPSNSREAWYNHPSKPKYHKRIESVTLREEL